MVVRTRSVALLLAGGSVLCSPQLAAQPWPESLLAGLRWRMIGPHRGGRTVAAVGVPGQPATFLIGVNNGGVWQTTDYGRVWRPLFDDQPTGSIGSIAVARSAPLVIYVGTGEGLQRPDLSTGDGVYKTTDGGRTWRNVGLRDAQQIPQLAVDPQRPDRVFAAALGHPYGANPERGVFRSLDGGTTWHKVLYRDENTGAFDVQLDPADPGTVYAVLWAGRQAPWEVGSSWQLEGSGLYKSTDGGDTWRQLGGGLPTAREDRLGRIGLCIAPSQPRRLYAVVDAPQKGGLWRSDDAGETWTRTATDARLWGRGSDFAEVRADPRNPDVVYVANVAAWKSVDGGRTFAGWRGAPGGDDYHRIWIDPERPQVILMAGDQGAIVTTNGGDTWSSWYNQPTAQLYHVSTDNAFPYRVYGGQQESGSVGIRSRGDDGHITFRDWAPVGVEEYGYVAPDPLDPDIVYGGKLTRFDRRTGQVQDIAPRPLRGADYRVVRTQPVVFSPVNPRALYFASNVVWKTLDGGDHWQPLSPDLTRASHAVPANLGAFAAQDPEAGKHRGVIYTLAPSPLDESVLWVGTDDGLIHRTRDGGKTWQDVTPPELVPWAKVSLMDASHSDVDTAYAAVNTFRLDELRPHIWRTRDGGKTWTHITQGIPDGGIVNVVREDPRRKGLLFAGTERAVYVSFDDGDHWQSLRRNMPATSIRDLVVKDDDLVVATHGRSFWILDDITPLRQLEAKVAAATVFLFAPQVATRVRWNQNTDTPLPPDEPAGENPPDGALLHYWLGRDAQGAVTLEILDAEGKALRRFRSDDPPDTPIPGRNIPDYWIRPPQTLATAAGMHRLVWDLHEAPPPLPQGYPIAAIAGDTPRHPLGPWVVPGNYLVRITADGQTQTRPFTVRMDPRVKVSLAELVEQRDRSRALVAGIERLAALQARLADVRAQLTTRQASPALAGLVRLESAGRAVNVLRERSARLLGQLGELYEQVQGADRPATAACVAALAECEQSVVVEGTAWDALRKGELAVLDQELRAAGGEPLRL